MNWSYFTQNINKLNDHQNIIDNVVEKDTRYFLSHIKIDSYEFFR